MATARRILIKGVSKESVTEQIRRHYKTGRESIHNYTYREVFLDKMNYAFIISNAYFEEWAELDLDFNDTVEEHDDFLQKLSAVYATTVIFGYEQTTVGSARFCCYQNGGLVRCIYQKFYPYPDRIIMETNVGTPSRYEKDFSYPKLGEPMTDRYKYLDFYDDIQALFEDYGYGGIPREQEENQFLHIEYLKTPLN